MLALPVAGLAAPSGGNVVAGAATIAQSGSTTTIDQSSNNAVINWQGFSIASKETVNFNQPSSLSATLNRVIGNEKSIISGALNANGRVFIVNSAGVLFTKGAQVNVGSLVASTLDIANADFMAGNFTFSGNSGAAVINEGRIHASAGGFVALLGKTVSNEGVISATLGTVALASGSKLTLNFGGDSLVDVTIDEGTLDALVENQQVIRADGGRVIMTASAADAVLSAQVNNSGVIEARTMAALTGGAEQQGSIKLYAAGGTTSVAGTLDASAPKGGDGGKIETSGNKVKIADNAVITTKSAKGKNGTWLVDPDGFTVAAGGGDITGAKLGSELASNNVTIASTSGSGADGDITVNDVITWMANTTLALNATNAININAIITGSGAASGLEMTAGTDININAPNSLQVNTLTATAGHDVNINAAQSWASASALTFTAGNDININDTVAWSAGTLTLNSGVNGGFINLNAVMTASGSANLAVTYNTGMDTSMANGKPTATYGTQFGGINPLFDPNQGTFVGSIDFTNNTAANPLTINGNQYTLITSMSQLDALDGYNAVTGVGTPQNVSGFYALAGNLDAGGVVYTAAPLVTGADGNGNNFGFIGTLEGLGHTISNLTITSTTGIGLNGLIQQIGFQDTSNPQQPGPVIPGTVRDIGIVNVLIQDVLGGGGSGDGALAGKNLGGTIVNAFATGNPNPPVPTGSPFDGVTDDGLPPPNSTHLATAAIAGGDTIGGLVGLNEGIIVNSHAEVSVYDLSGTFAGGLVGENNAFRPGGGGIAVLLNDYATGTVSAGQPGEIGNLGFAIGGFVGYNNGGVISNAYATGDVWSLNNNAVGGFVGRNDLGAIISNASSSGHVYIGWTLDQSIGADGQNGGGFVGDNRGSTINDSFTSSDVTSAPFPAFSNVGTFGGVQRSVAGSNINGITNNSTATGTLNGGPGPAYGNDGGTSTNVISDPGGPQPPGEGPQLPPSNAQPAATARANAQSSTQAATDQQNAVAAANAAAAEAATAQAAAAAAQAAQSATRSADAITSDAANTSLTGPPNPVLAAAAGTNATAAIAPPTLEANITFTGSAAADSGAQQDVTTGLGATINSIDVNGEHYDVQGDGTKGNQPAK